MAVNPAAAYRAVVPVPLPAADSTGSEPSGGLAAGEVDRRLDAHRRAVAFTRFLDRLATPLALALLVAGGVALVLRLRGAEQEIAPWALLCGGGAIACGFAAWGARGQRPNRRDAAAAVDTALRSGGLLMTLADLPAPHRPADWLARLEPRRDRWRDARPPRPWGRLAKRVAMPLTFLCLAWALPVETDAERMEAPDRTVAGDRLTGELAQTLAALAAGDAADPAALARAEEDLRRLAGAIGENGPTASQLEAADALRNRMLGAVAGGTDGANVGRLADTLATGADLLAGSGLLETDMVRDAAAAAGVSDPAALGELLAAAGENREAIEQFAASLTDEQRDALVAAGARFAAGDDPTDLLATLPPGFSLPEGVDLPTELSRPSSSPGSPAGPLADRVPSNLSIPDGATEIGGAAVRAFAPGLAATADLLGGFWPGGAGVPGPEAPAVRPAPPPRLAGPPAPTRRLSAGRPVPPRLRGVVRRYFSGDTPAPPPLDLPSRN